MAKKKRTNKNKELLNKAAFVATGAIVAYDLVRKFRQSRVKGMTKAQLDQWMTNAGLQEPSTYTAASSATPYEGGWDSFQEEGDTGEW